MSVNGSRRWVGALVVAAALLWSAPAEAVKFMTVEEAVKAFIPADAKIFKTTKRLTDSQRQRLAVDYGWNAKDEDYVFYVGKRGDAPAAYVFLVPEVFNTCFHKYAVGMQASGEVIETVIVELSCPRALPVNKKAFLGQFKGKRHSDALTTKSDIDAVTGATLSSEATAIATRQAVSLHNLLFAGGQPVKVNSDVTAARAAASGLIDKAIANGETANPDGTQGAAQLPPGK